MKYNAGWDDDTWRNQNFSEEVLASARQTNARQPTAAELIKAAEKYGPDGILDSAILLSQRDYRKVATALRNL